ncbi:DUF2515 family protein [Priestia taiwanensis]|uniref:DUF2515 domain-containing protein n=1 Tax=Priestia taiwanensis TaxID=1347902 RepID=A0A917AIY0_9BACI|nr:DUF2515 family protein [Priestia taiwanensis]MBM7361741.1 hypothetical protein [Priestia taiwanensis]GGE56610.1 hypothetical protein GCM10007140_03660 [Priestia taiwanensis]
MFEHIVSIEERELIAYIQKETEIYNCDNISRTKAYEAYYKRNDEIKWSFLAGMVSRNAGWNMTDLTQGGVLDGLHKEERTRLFLTYERANWLIFLDAYPQLLLYEVSKKRGKSFVHLLPFFHVSVFMKREWERYMESGDTARICVALIINEQHIIQKPVIDHPYFSKEVFQSFHFHVQEWLRISYVVFPTLRGELYGFAVKGFKEVSERIRLGKKLVALLFHCEMYPLFIAFASRTPPTGSRMDYEQYSPPMKKEQALPLHLVYPMISHTRSCTVDWYQDGLDEENWFEEIEIGDGLNIRGAFSRKQQLVHILTNLQG